MDRDRYVQIARKISTVLAVLGAVALVAVILVPMGLPGSLGIWILYLVAAAVIGPLAYLLSGIVAEFLLVKVLGELLHPKV